MTKIDQNTDKSKRRPPIRWVIWLSLTAVLTYSTLYARDDPALNEAWPTGTIAVICLCLTVFSAAILVSRSFVLTIALLAISGWAALKLDPEILYPLDGMMVWGFFIAALLSLPIWLIRDNFMADYPTYHPVLPHPLDKIVPGAKPWP